MHPKTVKALEQLEKLILFGDIGASGFLPAERDLATRLGIGRGALQSILNELIERKLLKRIPGKGIKVAAREDENAWRKVLVIIQEKTLQRPEQFEILRGIVDGAEENRVEVVLFFNRNMYIDRRLAMRLEDDNLVGVIFIERFPERIREAMATSSLPCVVANFEGAESAPAVRVDYRQIGRMAGRYFVERGHRRIGFAGGTMDAFHYREMYAGLKGALAEDDLVIAPELSCFIPYSCNNIERKQHIMNMLKKYSSPGAIFAGRDHWAKLIFECAAELGIRIPEDLSVIGNDNISWDGAAAAGLTSFTQPAFETGRTAVQLLCRAENNTFAIGEVRLMGKLVERSSVEYAKIIKNMPLA